MLCKSCKREIPGHSIYCMFCGEKMLKERRKRGEVRTPTAKQLPSGAWFCRVRVGGQDVSITRDTKEEAVAEAMAVKAGIKSPVKARANMTLEQAYKKYIESRSGVISPSTEAGYKRLQKNTFQKLMPMQLSGITTEHIQREVGSMAKSGKSPKYVRNAEGLLISVLKQFMPDAQFSVVLPQKQKAELRQIEDAEIGKIMKAFAGSEMELPVLMALWMGMRMSEIRGARYEDIKDGRLHICRAIVTGDDGTDAIKPPKTFSGDRWVSIPAYIQSLINSTGVDEGYIVTLSGQAIYKRFIRGLDVAGIQRCRFHDLRHANAAIMVRLGIESKYAQERNGWSSDRMYKQVYAYTMEDKMAETDKAINSYFDNKMATEIQKSE